MSRPRVAIIDYGMGNVLSVARAVEYCGATVKVTREYKDLVAASHIVLPGVGAFAQGMLNLQQYQLDIIIKEVINISNKPFLGICLGMQLLMDSSQEFGQHSGLRMISGQVISIPNVDSQGNVQKLPSIGWNQLCVAENRDNWQDTVFHDLTQNDSVYFTHSYQVSLQETRHALAYYYYGGAPILAAMLKENIIGCQFHPEKSGKVGLAVLKRFLMC